MGPTAKLLRRRHLPLPLPLSSSAALKNPNPLLLLPTFSFNRRQPSRTLNPSNLSSSRSFSWNPWTRSSNPYAGSGSATGSEFCSLDGSEAAPEEPPSLGFDSSGILEDDEVKSSDIGTGLSSVAGSDSELVEMAGLDQPWYAPFQDSLIWMMDGVHDLTGLPCSHAFC